METQHIVINDDNRDNTIDLAVKLLQSGKVVAIPTETVYGLAANALDEAAVSEIFSIKGRPADNPLIVHVADHIMLRRVVAEFPENAAALAKAFWPGPLTLVLDRAEGISDVVTAGLPTVAVRMPSQPTAAAIISRSGLPLAAPSANMSGRPSPTNGRHVFEDLKGKLPLIVDDGPCSVGLESTVITLATDVPTILRPGIISLEQIQAVLPETVLSPKVLQAVAQDEKVESPGMKYRHYAPRANITLIRGSLDRFINYVEQNASADTYAICFDGEDEKIPVPSICFGPQDRPEIQANRLFAVLRAVDAFGATSAFIRCPEQLEGAALAVYNRLLRASGDKVVEL